MSKKTKVLIAGGLLRVNGLGLLILGDSGIGKSETALELISRGHKFISDDVTLITENSESEIIGEAPKLSQNFMEIRGLGIINVKELYGENILLSNSKIDLIVKLKKWEEGRNYDRLGLTHYNKHRLFNIELPLINIPIAPGRNMALLLEVACKVYLLKQSGYHAPSEICKRLDQVLSSK